MRTPRRWNNPASVLLQLFVVLLAAKLGDEIFKRLGQPVVIGEILGGLVVGPAVLGLYDVNPETQLFAEIGVVVLLFRVGLDTRLHDLVKVGGTAILVAILGVLFPFAAGMGLGLVTGETVTVAVFLAAALTATSVGITSRVLSDLGALDSLARGRPLVIDYFAARLRGFTIGDLATGFVSADLQPCYVQLLPIGDVRLLVHRRLVIAGRRWGKT